MYSIIKRVIQNLAFFGIVMLLFHTWYSAEQLDTKAGQPLLVAAIELTSPSSTPSTTAPTPHVTSKSSSETRCLTFGCNTESKYEEKYEYGSQTESYTPIAEENKCLWQGQEVPCSSSAIPGSWWNAQLGCYFLRNDDNKPEDFFNTTNSEELKFVKNYQYSCIDEATEEKFHDKYTSRPKTVFYYSIAKGSTKSYILTDFHNMKEPVSPSIYSLSLKALEGISFPVPVATFWKHSTDEYGRPMVLVNASFWWWAGDISQWKPLTNTARAGQAWSTVTATPVGWTFDPGNGQAPVSCQGSGTAWKREDGYWKPSPSGCSYRYPHTSIREPAMTFTSTFTMNWAITWEASDSSTGTLPAKHRSSTATYPVGEAQTVITR
jgi:hypothetical protein